MQVDSEAYRKFLNGISWQSNGDGYEKDYGHYISKKFPNCERFWQQFVVPLTERMSGYPKGSISNIRFRQDIGPMLEDIAMIHYSGFLNLVYAHNHLENWMLSSLENIYTHLGSVCDLAETFLEKVYLLLLTCRGEQSHILQHLSRDEFLQMASDWYDEGYSTLYEHYLSKGKSPPLRLPSRKNLLKEFLENFLKQGELRKRYARHSQTIRQFRNIVVHDVQVGKIIIPIRGTPTPLIPKPKEISHYKSWRDIFAVLNDRDRIMQDFVPIPQQIREDLETLEEILNQIWEFTISEIANEFYSPERESLREMYKITLQQN